MIFYWQIVNITEFANSHIWILWKSGIQVEPLFISAQSLTVNVRLQHDRSLFVTCVYASWLKRVRKDLWEHLDQVATDVGQTHEPWMVTGDFNVIASTVEKQGGRQTDLGAIHDFQECISRTGLIDAGYQGKNFTWCNNCRGRARMNVLTGSW